MAKLLEQLNNTTYRKILQDNPKDFLEVEIGDSKQPDFKPQIKIQRWNNECNYSVRLQEDEKGKPSFKKIGEKINWKKGNIEVDFYEKDNAFKFDYRIKQKPATNKIRFTIQSKDVEFYYQPPLTQKEIDEGCIRPENVVGSYAVYAKTPKTNWTGGKLYRVGKVGHIYRPKLIDSNGWEVWANLYIDAEKGIYEVTIPTDFYNNAVYPIKSNDTFGYTTAGSSQGGTATNVMRGSLFTSPADAGTATSLTFHVQDAEGSDVYGKGILVLHSNLNIITNGIGNPSSVFPYVWESADWRTSTFGTSPTLSPSTEYVLMLICGGGSFNFSYDSGATNQAHTDGTNSYSSPTNPTDAIHNNEKYSIYCTYTPAAVYQPRPGAISFQDPAIV